jgi:NAD(P)-dependent dehydrogenase (short-subunit alcohol dehydrogenase family)
MECDLCSFDSIRNFSSLYNNQEERLDILICNAGLGYSSNEITQDGFNYVIQANYLGHFLLTNLLLNKLKESKPSRILNVSSDLHKSVKSIDWSDAFIQKNKSGLMGAYAPSKLFQILSTFKLKQDLFGRRIEIKYSFFLLFYFISR